MLRIEEINKLEHVHTLEWYEGPLLTLSQDKNKNLFLFSWFSRTDNCHIWLVFDTSLQNLVKYMGNEIEIYKFIESAKNHYLIDNDGAEWKNLRKVTFDELKEMGGLPSLGVYYSDSDNRDE